MGRAGSSPARGTKKFSIQNTVNCIPNTVPNTEGRRNKRGDASVAEVGF